MDGIPTNCTDVCFAKKELTAHLGISLYKIMEEMKRKSDNPHDDRKNYLCSNLAKASFKKLMHFLVVSWN